MNNQLLDYYERELLHLRDLAREFAEAHPAKAPQLGLGAAECHDPLVERLLEGVAFMAARVQLKIDAEFPRFTAALLEAVVPGYLAPLPAMTVLQFQPDFNDARLIEGLTLPRDTAVQCAVHGLEGQPQCEFRTAHDVVLRPLQVVEASFERKDLSAFALPSVQGVAAVIRLKLSVPAGLVLSALSLEELSFHLHGANPIPGRLFESLLCHLRSIVVRADRDDSSPLVLPPSHLQRQGLSAHEALLPGYPQGFEGYRLLEEYFACPERFWFLRLQGLQGRLACLDSTSFEILFLLDRADEHLDRAVEARTFALYCTPAINLFPMRTDRILLDGRAGAVHVLPDRSRPMDFEVHSIQQVTGYRRGSANTLHFRPLYAATDADPDDARFYTVGREENFLSPRTPRARATGYPGSEAWLTLVDRAAAPLEEDLREIGVLCLATNRDLPLLISPQQNPSPFTMRGGCGAAAVLCASGTVSRPRMSRAIGSFAWRLIDHLSLNYLTLCDTQRGDAAAAMRELLNLYAASAGDAGTMHRRQVAALQSVTTQPLILRIARPGPICFARGLDVTLTVDESAFEPGGAVLLSSVLECFLAKYVSINSFTRTTLRAMQRGEVIRWTARIGLRSTL